MMPTPNGNAVTQQPVTPTEAITAVLLVFLQRFVFAFGTVFGVLAAFRATGFLPGLFL